jgi:hypothetical protein
MNRHGLQRVHNASGYLSTYSIKYRTPKDYPYIHPSARLSKLSWASLPRDRNEVAGRLDEEPVMLPPVPRQSHASPAANSRRRPLSAAVFSHDLHLVPEYASD